MTPAGSGGRRAHRAAAVDASHGGASHSAHEQEQARTARSRARLLDLSADIAARLDFDTLAQRIVDGVTDVAGFRVAIVTLREGDVCRRLAASGIDDPRIGLETDYAEWSTMLRPEFRIGAISFLLPPGEGHVAWEVIPDLAPDDHPDAWTPEHGLILTLLDSDGQTVGFLSVDEPVSGRLPTASVVETLELFARQAQVALVNARLYAVARRQRDAAHRLRRIAQAVSASLDVKEVLKRCCDAAVAHSVGDRASVYLFDAESSQFKPMMSRGVHNPRLWRHFREMPAVTADTMPAFGEAFATARPVVHADVPGSGAYRRLEVETFGLRSAAAYPLVAAGEKVGILLVDAFRGPVEFDTDEIAFMLQVADHAAVALRQARLHSAVTDHAERAQRLYELTKAMTETFDFDEIFARVSEAIRGRMQAHRVAVLERDGDAMRLLQVDIKGETRRPQAARLPLTGPLLELAEVLSQRGSMRIDDVRAHAGMEQFTLPDTRWLLLAGHVEDERLALALAVAGHDVGGFSPEDEIFLRGLVGVTALALRNARLYDQTRRAAERDSLTGLRNRRMFWHELAERLATASGEHPTALAVLDLDDFKQINDRFGHLTGDQALVHVADRLTRTVRETDAVYRIGGEEFTVVMPDTAGVEAVAVIGRVLRAVGRHRTSLPPLSLSAGVAVAPADGASPDELFKRADDALYAVKRIGKDAIALASEIAPTAR